LPISGTQTTASYVLAYIETGQGQQRNQSHKNTHV